MTAGRTGPGAGQEAAGAPTVGIGAESIQLNVVFLLDVPGLLAGSPPESAVFGADNDPRSSGKATSGLVTHCRPGQVLNWLCRAVSEPQFLQMPGIPVCPAPSIMAIVFRHGQSQFARGEKVMDDLHTYGSPDRIRHPLTPSYRYWAGTVRPGLPPGQYHYRITFALAPWAGRPGRQLEVESASLLVGG